MFLKDSGQATEWLIGVRIPPGASAVCLLRTFHTSSGAQASYSLGNVALPPAQNFQGREADHSPPSGDEVKN